MNNICPMVWLLSEWLSIDEQTIGSKGNHGEKLRISYTQEGNSVQCDAVCDDIYTYSLFYRNKIPPEKYKHMSAIYARVLALFEILKNEHHRFGCNNIYVSAKILKKHLITCLLKEQLMLSINSSSR